LKSIALNILQKPEKCGEFVIVKKGSLFNDLIQAANILSLIGLMHNQIM
jgi:hypothetical protein